MPGPIVFLPLLVIVLPLIFVYSSASIYRSIYSEDRIRSAITVIAEYRRLKAEAEKSKRKMKRLRAMEHEYRDARRTLLRSTLVKTVLLMFSYVAGSLLFMSVMPGLISPYYIPGIVIMNEGTCVVASLIIFFLAYILFYAAYRDNFL